MSNQSQQAFPTLEAETRPNVPTAQAAWYLNRRPQTLRCWSLSSAGPINPLRINGRLAWPMSEIRKLCGEGAK
ncbi:DNA-binding protein [Variovorax paradoxus]